LLRFRERAAIANTKSQQTLKFRFIPNVGEYWSPRPDVKARSPSDLIDESAHDLADLGINVC
jgi:hypothetical protein